MPGHRNRIAMNPLLRKGGVHQRSQSSARQNNRHTLGAEIEDWYSDHQARSTHHDRVETPDHDDYDP